MKKIFARLSVFCLIVSIILGNINFSVYTVYAVGGSFNWDKSYILDATLNQVSRGDKKDNVLLYWDFGVNNGVAFDIGTYKLTYSLEDDKQIEFKVHKQGNRLTVNYDVFNFATYSYVGVDETLYQVYKTTSNNYIEPTDSTYPPISNGYEIIYSATTGKPTNASFNIMQNQGFSFKFDNRTVTFYWSGNNNTFLFNTDGALLGNVNEFNLDLYISGNIVSSESLQVFTGINTNTLTSTPLDNGRTISQALDQTIREIPDTEQPAHKPQLEFAFDKPKYWDSTQNKFVFVDSDPTLVVFSLGNRDISKRLSIRIEDIYAADIGGVTTVASETGVTVDASLDSNNSNRIILLLSNLEPGLIFNPVEISLSKPDNLNFLADTVNLEHGRVYTFPTFSVEPVDVYEYYMTIEPFKGYNGYYILYAAQTQTSMGKWAEYEEKSSGASTIYIPIDLSALSSSINYFKFEFVFTPPDSTVGSNQQTLTSQTIKYKTSGNDIIIGTQKNLTVVKSVVSGDGERDVDGNIKEYLYLTLKWDVAFEDVAKRILDGNSGALTIDYTFNSSLFPYPDSSKNQEEIAFAKIPFYYVADGNKVKVDVDKMRNEVQSNPLFYEYFENVTSYEIMAGDQKRDYLQHQITLKVDVVSKDSNRAAPFTYKNVYFISIGGGYRDNALGRDVTIRKSLPVSVTIDDIVILSVPPVQNLRAVSSELTPDKAHATFAMQWDVITKSSLAQYIEIMLTKKGLTFSDSESVRFDAYISANKDALLKMNDSSLIKSYDIKEDPSGSLVFDMQDDGSGAYMSPTSWLFSNTNNGTGLVKIHNIYQGTNTPSMNLQLDRVTKNQDYYMGVYAYIVPVEEFGNEDYEPQYSIMSGIVTITTPDDISVPETDDRGPEAPTNFSVVSADIDVATIKWDNKDYAVNYDSPDNYGLEYEIIKMRSKRIEDIEIEGLQFGSDVSTSFARWWDILKNNTKTQVEGIRTDAEGTAVYSWNGSSFEQSSDGKFKFELADNDTVYHLTDTALVSNELYFYYVRTVKYDAKGNRQYSIWVPLTLTTSPIGALRNLKAERSTVVIEKYEKSAGKKLNEYSEALISFDAPTFDDTKTDIYEFRYSVKLDGQSWTNDIVLPVNGYFDKSDANSAKYVKYYYKISGLTHGSAYDIRVRFYDKSVDDVSSYSNIVQIRTQVKQDDWDDDDILDDWVDYYKKELEKLGKEPYWLVEDRENKIEAIYRPSHFSGLTGSSVTSLIKLTDGNVHKGTVKTYYLAADSIDRANNEDKGFIVSYEEADLILSPKSIWASENDAILKITEDIKQKEAVDYYVRLTVSFDTFKGSVQDSSALSPTTTVEMSVVASNENIDAWDVRMQKLLDSRINDTAHIKSISSQIKAEQKDSSNEEMVLFVKELVEEFKEDFLEDVQDSFEDLSENKQTIHSLNRPVYYAYPVGATESVAGFERSSGGWTETEVIDYNGKKAIFSNILTSFVITGRQISLPGLSGMPNQTAITALFAKYGLSDYFGSAHTFNMDAPVTRKMALGSACKFMGAPGSYDMLQFMASRGVTVSSRGMDEPVSMQEAVYYTMLAYEVRTNTKLDTVSIRNYALTANVTGFLPKYKKSVQTAIELGIYTTPIVEPNSNMKVRDYLQVLANLSSKCNLL